MYGYQMVQAIEGRSEGVISIQIGSLYPVLYRLRDDACISEHEVQVGKRRFRVYYHMEPKGETLFQELLSEHNCFEAALRQIIPAISASEEDAKDE